MVNSHQRLREAFVAYRLNQAELAHLVRESQKGQDTETLLEHYADRQVDWRDQPGDLQGSLAFLGLDKEFAELADDQVWTPFQRALYRRLSQPEFDPPLSESARAQAGDPLFVETSLSFFDDWDKNKDTRLEAKELDVALKVVPQDPPTAASLATIRGHFKALESVSPSDGAGVSRLDLGIFADQGVPTSGALTMSINVDFQELLKQAESMTVPISLVQENISPNVIHQGQVGSCVLLSTAIGLPEGTLQSMFQEEQDGLYRVNFADGDYEIVGEPSAAERLVHARGAGQERWPALLETAMGQRLYREAQPDDHSLFSAMDGIAPEKAIFALTGKATQQVNLDEMSVQQTRETLREMTGLSGPVICGSRPQALGDFVSVEELYNGIANSHCYAIKGFDPERDMVSLQNPWHRGEWNFAKDSQNDGAFEMPLKDFYASFRWMARPDDLPKSSQV
jgi:hypothetical protein